jgi:hypothetical protein
MALFIRVCSVLACLAGHAGLAGWHIQEPCLGACYSLILVGAVLHEVELRLRKR